MGPHGGVQQPQSAWGRVTEPAMPHVHCVWAAYVALVAPSVAQPLPSYMLILNSLPPLAVLTFPLVRLPRTQSLQSARPGQAEPQFCHFESWR